jgi:mevalonate kinase
MTTGTAPGKVILAGEHASVYGYPALAVPVFSVKAFAEVKDNGQRRVGFRTVLPPDKAEKARAAINRVIDATLDRLGIANDGLDVTIDSTIPMGSGLGSGAAVAVATVKAIARHFEAKLSPRQVADIAFEAEKIHHGNPSGIDNTVIAFEKPIYRVKGVPEQVVQVKKPFLLVVADTGVKRDTKRLLERVNEVKRSAPEKFDSLMTEAGRRVDEARVAVEMGAHVRLGRIMDRNHEILQQLGVSHARLDTLVAAARKAGALGAKLTGAGGGGHMIALVEEEDAPDVARALEKAGAVSVMTTIVA